MRLFVAAIFLSGITMSWAWGPAGHKAVARIATVHLNDKARAEIAQLLNDGETLASISTWADEVRPQRRESAPWHYINVPVWTRRGDWSAFCPNEGCVVRRVKELVAYLKSSEGSREQRAEALKYLVHFVGDMHQPMHVGDRKDRGGNDLPVVFFGQPSNLHAIWDSAIVDRLFAREPQLQTQLDQRMDFATRKEMERGSVDDWLWEGQELSGTVAYRFVTEARPAILGAEYQAEAEIVVWRQLQRGGARLARLLNEIWAE